MKRKILILGASYGSLLGTKLLMAGHDVTLVCRYATAKLINEEGTQVRLRLKGEEAHRTIRSGDLPGHLDARKPEDVDPSEYDLVGLAMSEPQYGAHAVTTLLIRIAEARVPCLSIMNMPPPPFIRRLPGFERADLDHAYANARIWDRFDPSLVTLCSPDPQAFRPPEEEANVLHVGLPTNFKAAAFGDPKDTALLQQLADHIADVRLDGQDVPVKLRVHDSLFVPLAKWSMLLAGNYRCVLPEGARSIRDAVHTDIKQSREIYEHVSELVQRMGADAGDLVPFEKYAAAAENLLKPSSAARAIEAGVPMIERVDRLVQAVSRHANFVNPAIDEIVSIVDSRLEANNVRAA